MKLEIREMPVRLMLMALIVLVTSVASYGQSLGNVEVTGHLGIVGGIGTHASLGGSLAAPLTDRLILAGDLSYSPFGSGSMTTLGTTTSSSAKAINLNGTLQYEFKPAHGVVPYAGGGLGFLRSSFDYNRSGTTSFNSSGSS